MHFGDKGGIMGTVQSIDDAELMDDCEEDGFFLLFAKYWNAQFLLLLTKNTVIRDILQ